jgi:hypothetical protein
LKGQRLRVTKDEPPESEKPTRVAVRYAVHDFRLADDPTQFQFMKRRKEDVRELPHHEISAGVVFLLGHSIGGVDQEPPPK